MKLFQFMCNEKKTFIGFGLLLLLLNYIIYVQYSCLI